LYAAKRTYLKPVLFFLALTALVLTGCSGIIGSSDWPDLTTDGSAVYVAYGPGIMAVDVEERREVWRFPTEQQGQLQFFAAPELAEGRLFAGDYGASGGFLSPNVTVSIYALDNLESGSPSVVWQNDEIARDRIIAQPLADGDRVYVGTADDMVYALEADTGEEVWRFTAEQAIWGQPTVADGRVFISSLDRSLYALDEDDGSELWRVSFDGAMPSKPTVVDGRVYVGGFDSIMHALDAADGSEVWSFEAEDWIWTSPALADGLLYFGSSSGDFYALDAASGELEWRFLANGPIKANPLVHDGVVYVAAVAEEEEMEGQLLALSAGDGEVQWDRSTPSSIFNAPVIVGDSLVAAVQSEEALLLMFELATGDLQWEFSVQE
jgi:outer membrane protein assembly factor BamB